MKEVVTNYNINDVLRLRIIKRKRSLFDYRMDMLYRQYQVDSLKDPDLDIIVGDFQKPRGVLYPAAGKYLIGENLICGWQYYKGAKWHFKIEGLEDKKTTLYIDWNILGSLMGPGVTFPLILKLKFSQKGLYALHSSAVARNGEGYLFLARSGVGKTITVMRLVKDGFKIMGDDKNLVGNKKVYGLALPLHIKFTYDTDEHVRLSRRTKTELAFKKALNRLSGGYINILTPIEIKELFGEELMADKASLKKVFQIMQGDKFEITPVRDKKDLIRRIIINTQFELPELMELIAAYSHIFPRNSFSGYWKRFSDSLESDLKETECLDIHMPKLFTEGIYNNIMDAVAKK